MDRNKIIERLAGTANEIAAVLDATPSTTVDIAALLRVFEAMLKNMSEEDRTDFAALVFMTFVQSLDDPRIVTVVQPDSTHSSTTHVH